jgi:hypothetical protein
MPNKYDDLSKPELIRLLEARDRRDATCPATIKNDPRRQLEMTPDDN